MATGTFHKNTGRSLTRTLTASPRGQTTTAQSVLGPTGRDAKGRTGRPIYIKQSVGVFRQVGFEVDPVGATAKTTWDCQD